MVREVFRKIISVSENFPHYFNNTFTESKSVKEKGEKGWKSLKLFF